MEKILISAGIVLSLSGVWLMIEANIRRDKNIGRAENIGGAYHPKKYRWGWILLVGGIIAQIVGIWFPQIFQGISLAFARTPVVKNTPETGGNSLFYKILNDPALIIAVLALIATIIIAIASGMSVRATKRSTQAQLYLRLFEEYASPDMADALARLDDVQDTTWKKLADTNPDDDSKFIQALKKSNINGVLSELAVIKARRHVKYYFVKALRLYKSRFLSKKLMKEVGSVAGINFLYDVVKRLEKDSKTKSEIEEIRKICGRYEY